MSNMVDGFDQLVFTGYSNKKGFNICMYINLLKNSNE